MPLVSSRARVAALDERQAAQALLPDAGCQSPSSAERHRTRVVPRRSPGSYPTLATAVNVPSLAAYADWLSVRLFA